MTTTEGTRPFYATHRHLTAEECMVLAIFDEHKGLEPLKHASAEKRMIPIPYDESFLMTSGYLIAGKAPGGRPIRGTARITPDGKQAIRQHLPLALKDLTKRAADKDIAERQREIYVELGKRLGALKPRYQDDTAVEHDGETDSARSLPPVKRRDAKGKRIPLSKAVAAAVKGGDAEEGDEKSRTAPKGKGKAPARSPAPVASAAGKPPTRRR